jgi:hypothetical protein
MNRKTLKEKALTYRRQGKTYSEIRMLLGESVPPATLSYWFRNVVLSGAAEERRKETIRVLIQRARSAALKMKRSMRMAYLESVRQRNKHLEKMVRKRDIAKIILAMLYLGEGAKNHKRASVMLGSSDQRIVSIFLCLLRFCYPIHEQKLRCTVQCRADQDSEKLERFWSGITQIPRSQFYRARIDPRTIGKPSRKLDYKGVCRIEYFSADIFHDFLAIADIVTAGARSLEEKR